MKYLLPTLNYNTAFGPAHCTGDARSLKIGSIKINLLCNFISNVE